MEQETPAPRPATTGDFYLESGTGTLYTYPVTDVPVLTCKEEQPTVSSCVVGRVVVQVQPDGALICAPKWAVYDPQIARGIALAIIIGFLAGWFMRRFPRGA